MPTVHGSSISLHMGVGVGWLVVGYCVVVTTVGVSHFSVQITPAKFVQICIGASLQFG